MTSCTFPSTISPSKAKEALGKLAVFGDWLVKVMDDELELEAEHPGKWYHLEDQKRTDKEAEHCLHSNATPPNLNTLSSVATDGHTLGACMACEPTRKNGATTHENPPRVAVAHPFS
ncbi:hypothetical protein TorRG33x02_246240 [Trema orientale]|uniref:Uncharacterized protein n=1 Tax=Trema orientale TaxID=63057 RepID=A0A2P5DNJ3_TREOI|nr:hypothetical protein TorRG33x02_246240 [Trema orientale]